MAKKVAAATGTWSAAATWNSVTNTPTLHASTNITISTSNLFTATFTAPNTTNACTGVLLFINAIGSGGTVTVTLQESTVDTAAAVSIAVTNLVALTWGLFRFATPYVFTTTGAGAYRFKIVNVGAAGTTNAAADSGAANIAYLATDDRTGVPGTTDDIWICGQNQATAITVTMDGTQTIGSKTDTVVAVQRTLGNAISINNLGVLAWDTTADATLTCGGNIICNNNSGELQMGTVASPMPVARLARLRFDMSVSGNHGLRVFATGKLTLQGTPKSSTTLWKAKLSSGVGTAASPAIMDAAVDWSVGDEVAIGSTDTYDHTEYRFIITKNSATSYVWSTTSGGAEAALTHTHTTDAWVLNIQRNVLIDSTDATKGFYIGNVCTTVGNFNIDWTRFDIIGAAIASKQGLNILDASAVVGNVDYSVCSRHNAAFLFQNSNIAGTFTGLVAVTQRLATAGFVFQNSPHNKTLVDCFAFDVLGTGFSISTPFNVSLTRCYAIGCNKNNSAGEAGFRLGSCGFIVLNDCEVHAIRSAGTVLSAVTATIFTNYLCGTKGANVSTDVSNLGAFNTVVFINSSFGSPTLISNYLIMLAGSSVQFQTYNATANNHAWYTNTGVARSTGAGLVDTTNKTAGNLTVRLAPEDSTNGFVWEFLVGIKASTAASIFGFAQKNAAFGTDVCTIELFLPGSTVADATVTLNDTTGAWQVFNLAANYTGLVAGFATVRITAKTTTASAYVYLTDFYNGTNVLTGLQAWYNGKPSPVFTDLLGDPASVWAILTSTLSTPGTIGYQLTNGLTTIQADTDDLQTRIPTALTVDGNIKADVLKIEGVDPTDQIRDSILTDATRFAGTDISLTKSYVDTEVATILALLQDGTIGLAVIESLVDELETRLTITRAANLDNLDALVSSRATPAQVATELATYDGPTHAELISEINSVQVDIAALNNISPAEVNNEIDQALADINLDHLVGTATGIPAVPSGTYLDQIMDDGTTVFDRTIHSLQAIGDSGGGEATLSAATLLAIAKAVLKKGITSMENDGDFEVASLGEVILAHFESSIVEVDETTGNWIIRKVGGTTFNTRPVTLDATALPVKGVT